MPDSAPQRPDPSTRRASPSALILAAGGLTAAFAAATCCALPLLLGAAGLGAAAWLVGLGQIAAPHRPVLLGLAALLLAAGTAALWRQHRASRACSVRGLCASPTYRVTTLLGLLVGAGLLALGYLYA